MKRLIKCALLLALALAISLPVQAAERKAKSIGKGFKMGFNLAKFTGSDANLDGILSPDYRAALTVGGFVSFDVAPSLAIQPELYYAMKGAEYQEDGDKLAFKLDYLEMPLLLKVIIPTRGQVSPNLFFGPSLGIRISSKVRISSGNAAAEGDLRNVKSTDFGFVFGGGLDFQVGRGKITFDTRYSQGFNTVAGPEEGAIGQDYIQLDHSVEWKNSCIGLLFGYSF